jgi:DNA-binding LacI/PurR family transcriptional regulator
MPVTHQEIADIVGVSRVAVSQVLHKSRRSRISPEKQLEIERIAREMGYRPRNLTTHNIGYVSPADALNLSGESHFLRLIDRASHEAGYRLVLTTMESDDPRKLDEVLNPKTVDGVIFTRWLGGKIRNLLSPEVPWVVVSDEDSVPETVDQVVMDSVDAGKKMTRHLLEFGHQRICVLGAPGVGSVTTHLKNGARQVLKEAGLDVAGLTSIEPRRDRDIEAAFRATMSQKAAPTAFIVFGTEKIVTLFFLLSAMNLQIPRDVSLISLFDSYMFEPLTPQITATTAMDEILATRVVGRLLEKLADPNSPPRRIAVPAELIIRDSVASVAGRSKLRK